jgi:hypothetical protein
MLCEVQLLKVGLQARNRVFYLLGHLTAMHDRMFPLLGLRHLLSKCGTGSIMLLSRFADALKLE